uniref:Nuclease associated modular domain-containing protein n=1 Tax=Dactylella sp. TaxID=1814903 RepID=A0A482DS45_9PEZI|nr:hypothetical protein [Dactylella sp.]
MIYNALLKYGYSNFQLEILEYCDPKDCIKKEQYFIELLKPEYNILKSAGSRLGHKHSEETLVKFRNRKHSLETLLKMSNAKKGKTLSKETIAKLIGRKLSEETRQKMSEIRKGGTKPEGSGRPSQKIEVFDNNINQTKTYDSISEAAIALGIRKSAISTYISSNTNKLFKSRYTFKKV